MIMLKKDKKLIALLVVSILLIISLSLNFYQCLSMNKYSENFQGTMYQSIEEIKSRNEYIYLTTNAIINAESVSTNELLDLYNNYKMIYIAEVGILEMNLLYKNVENKVSPNNLFLRAEEFIKTILLSNENENESGEEVIIYLDKSQVESMKVLRDVAEEINNYFINIESTELKDKENDEKVNIVIREDFWIKIMGEIQKIGDKYSEYAL